MSTWRLRAAQTINQVIRENPADNPTQLEKKIRDAYPFNERKHYPYKIWLDEVNKTMKQIRAGTRPAEATQNLRNFWVKETP